MYTSSWNSPFSSSVLILTFTNPYSPWSTSERVKMKVREELTDFTDKILAVSSAVFRKMKSCSKNPFWGASVPKSCSVRLKMICAWADTSRKKNTKKLRRILCFIADRRYDHQTRVGLMRSSSFQRGCPRKDKKNKGKLLTSHRYDRLPLLHSWPGGVHQELVV